MPSDVGRQRMNEREDEKAEDLGQCVSFSTWFSCNSNNNDEVVEKNRIILTRWGLFDLYIPISLYQKKRKTNPVYIIIDIETMIDIMFIVQENLSLQFNSSFIIIKTDPDVV